MIRKGYKAQGIALDGIELDTPRTSQAIQAWVKASDKAREAEKARERALKRALVEIAGAKLEAIWAYFAKKA